MGKPRAVREYLARAGLVVLSVLATLLLLEAGFRVSGYYPVKRTEFVRFIAAKENLFVHSAIPGVRLELRPFQRWGREYPSNPRGYFDEFKGRNVIWYRTNNAGYRGRDFSLEKQPGTMRIAFLGDSFGFGSGVKDDDVVTARLEARLNQQSACPIEVYNFSVENYDTADEAALLEQKVLKYRPDLIILWYFLNDPGMPAPVVATWKPRLFPRSWPWLRRYSVLADFVGAEVDRVILHDLTVKTYHAEHQDSDERWMATKRHLERMAGLAKERGIPIYLFIHPELFRLGRYPFQAIHDKVLTTARGYGFRAFDLLEAFRGRDAKALWVHPLDRHPNEEAHRLAAEYVAGVLSQTAAVCRFN